MPGQKLKHKRRERIEKLTDAEAVSIARDAMKLLSDAQLLAILAAKPGTDFKATVRLRMQETRSSIANQVAADPERARVVVGILANHPSVEKAIGLKRSPSQLRAVDRLAGA